jgi:hypothetical protein
VKPDPTIATLLEENKALRAEMRKPKDDATARALFEEAKTLRAKVKGLERELAPLRADAEARAAVQHVVTEMDVPRWAVEPSTRAGEHGVPSILATDWHTGETINERLIGGVNRYSRAIQEERVRLLAANGIEMLTRHTTNPRYPGLVLAVGGDMVSGGIHEELEVTNWCDIRDAVRITARLLCGVIRAFAEKVTPNILVPMVTGNHGRLTKFTQHKRRVGTSADAMVYDSVAEYFHRDRSITVAIAEGVSLRYRIFDHRYLLLHGDKDSIGQKGGDGIIGAIGPLMRGKKNLRARNAEIGQDFDTLITGHWHTRYPIPGLIVGQALKGYDELAWGWGFPFGEPTQELWFTHPDRGVTSHHPIYLEPKRARKKGEPWATIDPRGVSTRGEEAA